MACVLWQEECETEAKKLMKNIKNIEHIMKEIWKEYEDKDGSKGRGYVQEISRLMRISKIDGESWSWKTLKPTYFQKIS